MPSAILHRHLFSTDFFSARAFNETKTKLKPAFGHAGLKHWSDSTATSSLNISPLVINACPWTLLGFFVFWPAQYSGPYEKWKIFRTFSTVNISCLGTPYSVTSRFKKPDISRNLVKIKCWLFAVKHLIGILILIFRMSLESWADWFLVVRFQYT